MTSYQLFLSLILLSCMVVPIRELVNVLFPIHINLQSIYPLPTMNIKMNNTRDYPIASSPNLFGESFFFSKSSSMEYAERIQA